MYRRTLALLISAVALLISSCSRLGSEDNAVFNDFMSAYPSISGQITDETGRGIEHIKVTLEWKGLDIKDVIYTSSDGEFKAGAYYYDAGSTILTITLEDVDGLEYGGPYASVSETIILFEGGSIPTNYHIQYNRIMTLSNPSTVSVSSL